MKEQLGGHLALSQVRSVIELMTIQLCRSEILGLWYQKIRLEGVSGSF